MARLSVLPRLYLWATERLYNEWAWAYDLVSWVVSLGRWSQWRRMALEYVTGGRVLEIGFGTGELLIEMAERGWSVCGLEPSAAMHRVTAGKMRRRGIWAPRIRGCAQALPFADGSLDVLIATFPAGYILSPDTLQEAARVLRDPDAPGPGLGGRLIVAGFVSKAGGAALQGAAPGGGGRSGENALQRWMQAATAAGFEVTVASVSSRLIARGAPFLPTPPPHIRFREQSWQNSAWPVFVLEKSHGAGSSLARGGEHGGQATSSCRVEGSVCR